MKTLYPLSGVVVLGVFILGGCLQPELSPPKESVLWVAPDYKDRAPVDVAIFPIASHVPEGKSFLPKLREKVYDILLTKRYSPLSLDYVDEEVKLVGYSEGGLDFQKVRGQLKEDAILVATLTRFDKGSYQSSGETIVGANFLLIDAKSGDKLWSYEVEQVVDLNGEQDFLASSLEYERRVAEKFIDAVLKKLPDKPL